MVSEEMVTIDNGPLAGSVVHVTNADTLKIFRTQSVRGKSDIVVVGGLFAMHDERGVPLCASIDFCIERGATPAVNGFVCDAIAAGWKPSVAVKVATDNINDSICASDEQKLKWIRNIASFV